jgi:hypothetical protein
MKVVRLPLPTLQNLFANRRRVGAIALLCTLTGCSAAVPRNLDSSCAIFDENPKWYHAAKDSEKRWGTPTHVQLAIIYQESKFIARARPPRRKILWVIPGPRPSSAYGYTQAITPTWKEYVDESGNWFADRNDFSDSADFVGWYTNRTSKRTGISKNDTYSLYLAYHEGDNGFRRGTYKRKSWLLNVAGKVRRRADTYRRQLASCADDLNNRGWFSWL